MRNRVYWGLGVLIVLILGVFVHVMVNEHAKNKQLKAELKEAKELANQIEQQQVSENNPPPAEPGFKWVWHHNHWDKVPINANGPIVHHEDPIDEVTKEMPVVNAQASEKSEVSNGTLDLPTHKGMSLYSRVAASDDVPKYSELKAMNQDELRDLVAASYAKAKSYDSEVNELWDAWIDAPDASDEEKTLKASLDAVLTKQFVHSATGSKAFDVFYWRSTLQLQNNPLPNLIIMPIVEPFD